MKYDEEFFAAVGLSSASEERKQQLGEQLAELTQNRLAIVLADNLSDEQLEEFDNIADEKGDAEALAYIQSILPNYDELVATEVAAVKQAFIDDMNMLLEESASDAAPSVEPAAESAGEPVPLVEQEAAAATTAASGPASHANELHHSAHKQLGAIPLVPATQADTPHLPS